MPVHENREHFRIEDQLYFDYKVLDSKDIYSDKHITEEFLGRAGSRYLETIQYFQSLDYELAELTRNIATADPSVAHYLNVINEKIDYLTRHFLIDDKIHSKKANISLGGMAFKTKERLQEKTRMKIVIYTKPKMTPIVLDAKVVFSQYHNETSYHTAVQFEKMDMEQEQLLSQHIIICQARSRAN